MSFYLGIDFGTSGARAIVIDHNINIQAEAQYPFVISTKVDLVHLWKTALFHLIEQIPLGLREQIKTITINGTSSTVMLCDRLGNPLAEPLMYDDNRGAEVMEKLREIAPDNHPVISATSSLAKLLWMSQKTFFNDARYFLHQADWLAFLLHDKLGISDYHNALKLGYDVENLCYPDWLLNLPIAKILPQVITPGTPIAEISNNIVNKFGLPKDCLVCAGTTDSIAAFLASGANSAGEAVTSLGSTLVIKLLSYKRVDDATYGIYSHRLDGSLIKGDNEIMWLVGGASNTGGAVLQKFFNNIELENLSRCILADKESPLDYYPLTKPGERFPINDPNLQPRLVPRPDSAVEFLHGLLEGIARIEAQGYGLLQQLGANPLTRVYTAGGGAHNPAWIHIRHRHLQVPILPAMNTSAALGTAMLGIRN